MHLFKAIELVKFIAIIKIECEPNSKKENKNIYPLLLGHYYLNRQYARFYEHNECVLLCWER